MNSAARVTRQREVPPDFAQVRLERGSISKKLLLIR